MYGMVSLWISSWKSKHLDYRNIFSTPSTSLQQQICKIWGQRQSSSASARLRGVKHNKCLWISVNQP